MAVMHSHPGSHGMLLQRRLRHSITDILYDLLLELLLVCLICLTQETASSHQLDMV